jgi:hypothetical protein
MALSSSGMSDYAVARETGISRITVFNWRHGKPSLQPKPVRSDWRPDNPRTYSYLLGVYLGDGCLVRTGASSWRLVVVLDQRYPGVVDEVSRAMRAIGRSPLVVRDRPGAKSVEASSPVWPAAFPQHGPGRKHLRKIELVGWQREITHAHPKELLRGLIHSDGCRCINRFKTKLPSGRVAEYEYPRYFFTNLSEDIRGIFCEHCDLLGIRWTQSNHRNISVSHRRSVALLDGFVGPKA